MRRKLRGPSRRRRIVGCLQEPPATGIGAGGVFGVFNVIVDQAGRCDDVSFVTVIIPFAPAAAGFLKTTAGVRVEVIGRPEGSDQDADVGADVVVAERITVLLTGSPARDEP